MDKNYVRRSRRGLIGFFGFTFIILKLVGAIDWPWVWVLFPIWIKIVFGILFYLFASGLVLVATLKSRSKNKSKVKLKK